MNALPSNPAPGPDTAGSLGGETDSGAGPAADHMVPAVYDELRRVAARYFRARPGAQTLQPTALVHEAYLKLADQTAASYESRAHFMAVAATAMRHILVDRARSRGRLKRGGGLRAVTLDEALVEAPRGEEVDLVRLDDAIRKLADLDPRKSRIVELRFFGGLSIEETASVLGIARSTITEDWRLARAWLACELGDGGAGVTSDRFQRVAELFREASRRHGADREHYLDGAAGGDAELRAEVDRLLAADEDVPAYLEERRLAERAARLAAEAFDEQEMTHPRRIGDYDIRGVLGIGGMGIVYEAQRTGRPVVALKVIRSGVLTAETIRRFDHEVRTLSRLRHPGIARIIDAGTFDGDEGPRPFFAMELVDGPPLLEHAAANDLDVDERLDLVCAICEAVQYAHVKGVIHRDLKPANILVEEGTKARRDRGTKGPPPPLAGEGRGGGRRGAAIKVLDFGVARATDLERVATTLRTSTGQLVGTLRYMSPEQVAGDVGDVDTRSDVYALGVLTYELLTGSLPYDLDEVALHDAARVICIQPPRRPSSVDRRLRGDLETVLLKSLDKDRDRRYQSPAALAADLRHVLQREPIEARRDSPWYVARKFASRHRTALGVAAVFALLLGVLASLALHESVQRKRRAAEALNLAEVFRDDEAAAGNPFRESGHTTPEKLEAFAAWVDASLDDLPLVEASSRVIIGTGYHDLGMYEEAAHHLGLALERRRSAVRAPHEDLARDHELLGRAHYESCRYDLSAAQYEQAIAMRRRLHGDAHVDLAATIDGLAACRKRQCRFDEAQRLYREALEMRRSLLSEDDPWIAASINNLATCLNEQGQIDEAESHFREALARAERAGVRELYLARGRRNIARCRLRRGDVEEAERLLAQALAELESSGNADHPDVGACLELQAWCDLKRGDLDRAEQRAAQALAIQAATLSAPHDALASTRSRLAELALERGRIDSAGTLLEQALDDRRLLFVEGYPRVLETTRRLGEVRLGQGRLDEAHDLVRHTLEAQRRTLARGHPEVRASLDLLGRVLIEQGRASEAEPMLRQSLRLAEEGLPGADWTIVRAHLALGRCLGAQQRWNDADFQIRRAEIALGETTPQHRRGEVWREMVGLYEASERGALAASYQSRLDELEGEGGDR